VLRLAVLAIALASHGCGARCAEIAGIKATLVGRTTSVSGAHVEVRIPFTRANALLDQLLQLDPIATSVDIPALDVLGVASHRLNATVREVRMRAAGEGKLGFAIRVELADGGEHVTTLALAAEVRPAVVHEHGATAVVVGFGPENLVGLRPELDAQAQADLARALRGWLPIAVAADVPQILLEAAARELGEDVTGKVYELLQRTLLRRLGEVTQMRVELPELPVARVVPAPRPDALAIEIALALPVRQALVSEAQADDDISVRVSASAAAELANWAIDHGHLPRHYTRDLDPVADGEYRPYFDYLADDRARPLKIHVVQERGGCSYYRVGMRPAIRVDGDRLVVELTDRWVERAIASPLIEAGLWLQQLVEGSVDKTRREVAHARVRVGHRTLSGEVIRAGFASDELRLTLRLALRGDR
jgi:hypothetical protein